MNDKMMEMVSELKGEIKKFNESSEERDARKKQAIQESKELVIKKLLNAIKASIDDEVVEIALNSDCDVYFNTFDGSNKHQKILSAFKDLSTTIGCNLEAFSSIDDGSITFNKYRAIK